VHAGNVCPAIYNTIHILTLTLTPYPNLKLFNEYANTHNTICLPIEWHQGYANNQQQLSLRIALQRTGIPCLHADTSIIYSTRDKFAKTRISLGGALPPDAQQKPNDNNYTQW